MPGYAYKARDGSGRLVSGFLEAGDQRSVAERLREKRFFVVEIKPQASPKAGGAAGGSSFPGLSKKISSRDLAIFSRQLSTMVAAGMPLLSCLSILQRQTAVPRMRQAIENMHGELEQGSSFYEAVSRHPDIFPSVFTNMVEAGELGGVLDDILERMAMHFEKEHDLNEKVRSALSYPAVISVVAVVAVAFILVFVLPTFANMLEGMGVPLPLPTKLVMGLSNVLISYWYLLPGILAGAGLAIGRYIRTANGRRWFDGLLLRMPIFGDLIQKMVVSRFTRTLGTLIKGGVPLLQALEVVKKTAGNVVIAEGVERARNNIREGEGMARPLTETGVFPPMVTEMIAVGEETGALDTLLEKISIFYDREVDAMVGRLSSMLEPVLIVGLGAVVGFIVISIMLPMFSILGGAGVE